jgi:hypothetical protein
MDSQAFGYTDGSLFGYDVYGGGYVRLDLQTAEATAGLYCPEATRDTQYAYQPSGGSFYTFDPGTRRVTRYAAWW